MSDVVDFKRPAPPTEPPKNRFGNDEWLLKLCAEWRVARAMQQANWAAHEAATMWGTLPDADKLDRRPLERMGDMENVLAAVKPRTMLLARELLGIAVTILAYRSEDPDPEATLGQGPVLEILHNVLDSLGYCKAETRIDPKRGMLK